ncbi:hypothetical protein TRICHSKD4_0827 [Roseibium sp. TrichSKD4]|uniref:hypothetical protein n=1 Tax=Roseibium sp. TrichSKD4 TaxID=744980 RepID=UPI0001E5614B|nr:hypothetical protein [Roseibium sp. TrichSKD4]EFO33717.1 hypothetical protein TRICHSKD4_0827 [Roseibium sp. TrichSKD4]
MQDPKGKKSKREEVRETFTPQRLSVASWAVAAILFGTVGMASFKFSHDPSNFDQRFMAGGGGLPLPAAGPVSTTASVSNAYNIEVADPQTDAVTSIGQKEIDSHLETLQLQIAAMRRRIETLSEQNRVYSTRIAALERDLRPGEAMMTGSAPKPSESMTIGTAVQEDATKTTGRETAHAKPISPDKLETNLKAANTDTEFKLPQQPVRLVKLPDATGTPQATGSIPSEAVVTTPPESKPQIVQPSKPVGRFGGAGASGLNSSTFGAAVGTYESREGAMVAWSEFKYQNEERMRDLEAMVAPGRDGGESVTLLVGPFGNAADAAVACLRLLEVSDKCHPALFTGEPLGEIPTNTAQN